MATVLPFIQKDVFGGPSGSTQDAMKMLVQGILANSQKRRENRQNQMARGIISGVGADNPNATGTDFVNALLSSNLRPETIKNWSNLYGTQSDINLNEAQAQNLRTPKPGKEKRYEIEYWDPDGTRRGGKILVPESKYNDTVTRLENAGFSVQKPEKEPKPATSEFERLIDKIEKAGNISEGQKNRLIGKRVEKLIQSGGETDNTNKITLGDGQRVTLSELRGLYRETYNIPDEFELMMMEASDDPAMKTQALKLQAMAAEKPTFVEFMRDAVKNGLEGLRKPTTKTGSNIPQLPAGFVLDQQ